MGFQTEPGIIRWKLHLASTPERVFEALATSEGRARYWAESAVERDGVIEFRFVKHPAHEGAILRREPPRLFAVEYFGSRVTFTLADDGRGGTDLSLLAEGVPEAGRMEMVAGWVSVLLAMKAALDFGVDLRNHDPARSWQDGFVDN